MTRSTKADERRHESAVSQITHSGYELVKRKRKPHGKIADLRDYAKINWDPWKRESRHGADRAPALRRENGRARRVSARLAYGIMLRTREQLIELHANLDHEVVDKMMADLSPADADQSRQHARSCRMGH
jgi:hypothetical protein